MWTWPALLLAPLLALVDQSIAYALATPACQTQREAWLHGIPLAFLAATLLMTFMAWAESRRQRGGTAPHLDADRRALRRYFVACVAAGMGALSSLAIAAMWLPQWVLSPCAG